ncbi:MAG: biopolymer transporter Tol [Cyanobacteria bacterium J083]|nr:MAG: biopolymer transporter Tol [Cyanobacteria bacterium J083]
MKVILIIKNLVKLPRPWLRGVGLVLFVCLSACSSVKTIPNSNNINSPYNDGNPTLSGDGRWLALVSNRAGVNQIYLYDLEKQEFAPLPGLTRGDGLLDNPSLSRTARYMTYVSLIDGRPVVNLYDRVLKRSEILTKTYRYWFRNPSISSDGRYLVLETSRRGQWDIEVIDRGPNIELDIPDGTPIK